jgi:hypothetical protein
MAVVPAVPPVIVEPPEPFGLVLVPGWEPVPLSEQPTRAASKVARVRESVFLFMRRLQIR